MIRRSRHRDEAPGQDSFLDIVANLVGILLILIMVVGVRAKDALIEAAPVQAPGADELDLETPQRAAAQIERDMQQLAQTMRREDLEIAFRRRERDKLQLVVAAAEDRLEQVREQLDGEQRRTYDLQSQLDDARRDLEQLRQQQAALEGHVPSAKIIEHLPTPMAKTVFGRELHFRLREGRLAYVPWDELVEQLKEEVPQKAWKLKEAEQMTETLGPVSGFRMKYTLVRKDFTVSTQAGARTGQRVELDEFQLIPVRDQLGENLQEALAADSELQQRLADAPPKKTTVTVWVYPDSFHEFRQLKHWLFDRGFLTAARPLPADQAIGGSPRGTRSAAQ